MIYFATCRDIGRVKIGYASEVKRRIAGLRVSCPLELKLEAVVEGGRGVEAALHERFASARVRGEWFTITPEIEGFISANRVAAAPQRAVANSVSRVLSQFGISQYALADRLGVTQATVSRMASGKMTVSRRTELALRTVAQSLQDATA
jgi:predicted XRE-type DNA-binding protein